MADAAATPAEVEKQFPAIDLDAPCFLRVPIKCLSTVLSALRKDGFETEAKEVEEFTRQYTDPEENAARLEWIENAEINYGEIEVDKDAAVSGSSEEGENGEYVMAWLWVGGPEEDDEDEDDDL